MSLKAIMGMVLAAIIVMATILFWNQLYSMFFGNKIDPNTLASFNRLTADIKDMADNKINEKTIPYYINDDYVLIGFNEQRNYVKETCAKDSDVAKPSMCRTSACLCICDRDTLCRKKPIECKEFEGVKYFALDPSSPTPAKGAPIDDSSLGVQGNVNYLVIYGQDCDWSIGRFGVGIGTKFDTKDIKANRIEESPIKSSFILKFD